MKACVCKGKYVTNLYEKKLKTKHQKWKFILLKFSKKSSLFKVYEVG